MPLRHCLQHIHDFAIHQSEIARIHRDTHIGNAIDQPIEQRRAESLEPALALTFCPDGVHDLVAILPLLRQFGYGFRRILQVRVDDDHGVAPCIVPAGRDGDLMAEVAREDHRPHVRSFLASARMASVEPSVDPSSTRTSSQGSRSSRITAETRAYSLGRTSASLKTGATME